MKKILSVLLTLCLLLALSACGQGDQPTQTDQPQQPDQSVQPDAPQLQGENVITLSDEGVTLDGSALGDSGGVYVSHDIIYYEDRNTYDSGDAYGEGEDWEKHSADDAAAHTVVNITQPGTYTVTGKLSRGQIRVDLGEEAFTDPAAVVTLVLQDADITCGVAPAILFLNVYECDNQWEDNTPTFTVDTASAGANLVVEGENTVNGSHVAKIFKDGGEEKKLWKQDAAVYSYMSMNVSGEGSLDITADNEGLDTELHLTINSGDLTIRSGNDGINTNEDGVSVTTINGGTIHILAGLGEEGDGVDSNGWLVINGGTVIASANPAADAGLDSNMGSYINGGTVLALGSTMDWAESDSQQVTMNLQFAQQRAAGSKIAVTDPEGAEAFFFDIAADPVLSQKNRTFQGVILSCAGLELEQTYQVQVNGVNQSYTGTDVQMRPGMGGFGGKGDGFGGGRGQRPENGQKPFDGTTPPQGMENMTPPEGFENMALPEGFQHGQMGEGKGNMTLPEGFTPGELPDGTQMSQQGDQNTLFYMQDKVNNFSGVTDAE